MIYPIIKWLHVLSAILALGANLTYGFWMSRAARSPENLGFTLRAIQGLDRALANRGYIALLVTGLLMVFVGHWALTTSWLIVALVLYIAVAVMGFALYSPTLRRQIQLAEMNGVKSPDYQAVARRSTLLGVITIGIVVMIIYLMVTKPTIWS